MADHESLMQSEGGSLSGGYFSIGQQVEAHPLGQLQVAGAVCPDRLGLGIDHIDVRQIVEVLPVETPEYHHATSNKLTGMPSPRLRDPSANPHVLEGVAFRVDDDDILQVVAEPASKDVDPILKDSRSVPPAGEEGTVLEFEFPPLESLGLAGLEEASEVYFPDVP